jgi:hypothetical protein
MSNIYRSICIFFLLLAGLVISAHMIIPHDHHLSDTINGQRDGCPVSDGKSGHSTGLPVHCHAFNDLAAKKFTSIVLIKNILSGLITIIQYPEFPADDLQIKLTSILYSGKPFSDIYFPDSSPFRAPPSVS